MLKLLRFTSDVIDRAYGKLHRNTRVLPTLSHSGMFLIICRCPNVDILPNFLSAGHYAAFEKSPPPIVVRVVC